VIVTASSADALALLETERPDVIVADIAMPDEDGERFIERLRARPTTANGATPALALTAYAGDGHRSWALSAGFQEYLAKPIDAHALVTTLIRLAARTAAVDR
jgi:CheY-like chemotaxis protein